MGNRHSNKKLTRAVRARMATTGESYQKALSWLLESAPTQAARRDATGNDVDLLSIRYFGVPAAVATIEIAGRLAVLVLSSPHRPAPFFPYNPLVALGAPRAVH
jgi:hypothetical protein